MDQVSPEGVATPEAGASVTVTSPTQNTVEVEQAGTAAAPPTAPVETPKQEPKGVAKRIDELTRNWREAQRQNERLTALVEQLATKGREAPQQQQPAQPKSLKDFNYNEQAYQDHLYTEARKAAEQAAREAGVKWKAEQEAIARRAKFDERVAQFSRTVEDYSEVVTDSTPVSEAMADAIMDSDEAGALMYYFGQNPEVALRLYHLSPAKAGREIQKIEDRLVAERKKAAEKPVSQAPPPPPKIDGVNPDVQKNPDDMPIDQWMKWREKQLRKKAQAAAE